MGSRIGILCDRLHGGGSTKYLLYLVSSFPVSSLTPVHQLITEQNRQTVDSSRTMVLFMLRDIHGDYPVGVLLLCTGRVRESNATSTCMERDM